MHKKLSKASFTGKADSDVKGVIWPYWKGYCKAYLEDRVLAQQIGGWLGCQISNQYYRHAKLIGWDVIFPSRLYDRVAALLGLPKRVKNFKRVRQGKRMAGLNQKYRFSRITIVKRGVARPVNAESRHRYTGFQESRFCAIQVFKQGSQKGPPKPQNSESE